MANSDYGSDIDLDGDDFVDVLIRTLDTNPIASRNLELENLVEDYNARSKCVVHVPRSSQGSDGAAHSIARERLSDQKGSRPWISSRPSTGSTLDYKVIRADREAVETFARRDTDDTAGEGNAVALKPSVEELPNEEDKRSPLERFRTAPKKPLSVTDIVSPAWCELQYWYALTKFGKKQRTPAMRQGSAVHRTLEEQVHTIVSITVQTKEDGWALKIWNVIQGLRTLRITGMTRELEIWGVLDGQVVNGVIDELSYTCTHPELEAEIEAKRATKTGKPAVPADQQTLEQFFSSQRSNGVAQLDSPLPSAVNKIYLTDIKTRARHTLPTQAAMRPTMMQLMLYRSLFASLAANEVPADTIFSRYGIDSSAPFTETFLGEIGTLDFNHGESIDLGDRSPDAGSGDEHVAQELHQHNNLALLWQLMMQEFAKTISSQESVSDVLCARFIHAQDETVLGSKCFAFDQQTLDQYVQTEMQWWKGERPAIGVDIEEAYKCRICEFADGCTWRKEKIEEAVGRHRERRGRVASGEGVG